MQKQKPPVNAWVFNTPEYMALFKQFVAERQHRQALESAMLIPQPSFGKDVKPLPNAMEMAAAAIEKARLASKK